MNPLPNIDAILFELPKHQGKILGFEIAEWQYFTVCQDF